MSRTKQIAEEGELRFAAEFKKRGWSIFFPYGEDGPIDLLIHKDGQFKKVQVKTTKPIRGAIICKLRSTNNWQNKIYTNEEVDLFGLYDYINQKGYLIEFKDFDGMTQISFRIDHPKNNQKKGIRGFKEFSFF